MRSDSVVVARTKTMNHRVAYGCVVVEPTVEQVHLNTSDDVTAGH